jgi:membrane protease YdiL (CAAX protease family)
MSEAVPPDEGEVVMAAARVPPPLRAALPWRGFLVDAALAGLLLIGLSLLLIVPIVFWHAMTEAAAGAIPDSGPDLGPVLPAITVAAIVAMMLTAALMWWLRGRRLPGTLPRMAAVPATVLAIVAGIAIQILAQGFMQLLELTGSSLEPSNAQPIVALVQAVPWLAWAMVVLAAPFAEELLMRHVLLRRFALARHAAAGVVLTSLAFALLHEPVPGESGVLAWLGGLVLYGGMGAGFAWVYLRTGRFRATFLAHAVCNAAALAAAAYSAS